MTVPLRPGAVRWVRNSPGAAFLGGCVVHSQSSRGPIGEDPATTTTPEGDRSPPRARDPGAWARRLAPFRGRTEWGTGAYVGNVLGIGYRAVSEKPDEAQMVAKLV